MVTLAPDAPPGQSIATLVTHTHPSYFFFLFSLPQRAAVAFSLASEDVALVHGPPGTGKTTTLVELLLQVTGPAA